MANWRSKLASLNLFKSPVSLQKSFKPKKKRFRWSWRTFGIVSVSLLATFILVVVFLFAWFARDLPTPNTIKTLVAAGGSTRVYDRNMQPLYTISGDKKQIVLNSNQIPTNVKQATISLEDRTFYTNSGIDLKSILRALLDDLIHRSYSQGASTITQQLAKNALLTDDKSLVRKIKEAILAIEINTLFNKDQILTMYLNEIPYGGNNYGIEAASRTFYGISADKLDLAQAATLASLPQAPTTYSPYGANLDLLLQRRNYALDTMENLGYITPAQDTTAKAEGLNFATQSASDASTAPHFIQYVKDWLVSYFTQQLGDQQLAEQKIEDGGLTVVTTLDLNTQALAEKAVQDNVATTLKRAGAGNASLVAMDPKTGEILAMVGSVDYNQPQWGEVNMADSPRQPGSSFKPIVYATAFKGQFSPGSTLFDLQTDFGAGYIPQNYSGKFSGPVTVRQAIGNSLNIPAVKATGLVGVPNVLKTASDFGITTLGSNASQYGLSLALGSGEVTVTEMANAYSAFANNGQFVQSTPVLNITDNTGKVLYDHTGTPSSKQVLDPAIAYEINNMLSDVNAKKPEFTNVLNVLTLPNNRPVATKTGTSNNYRDAWTIGYTPQLVAAVWAGNNSNAPMTNASIGAIAAAPIWEEFMAAQLKGAPIQQFDKPSSIQTTTIDRYSNLLPSPNDPQTTTDIAAPWQVPTKVASVYQTLAVCRENGLPADSSVPTSLTTNQTFVTVHSEIPDNPSWEQPVEAWAKANGLYNPAPNGTCSDSGSNVSPSIQMTSPANNSTVSGMFTISANASAPSGVASVQFSIDNSSIATITSSPYSTTYNANQLSNGSHTISAVITSTNGSTANDQVTVTVSTNTTPPHDVSSFTGTAGIGSVTLNWTNPSDGDLASILIEYCKQISCSSYTTTTVPATPSTAGTIKISGLTSATAYEFIAKAVDTSGNQSAGVGPIYLTPL